MNFPQYPTLCEVCKINPFNFICHIVFCGQLVTGECHTICSSCVAEHMIDIMGEYKAFLDCWSLPVMFTQRLNDSLELEPIQREGRLFEYVES